MYFNWPMDSPWALSRGRQRPLIPARPHIDPAQGSSADTHYHLFMGVSNFRITSSPHWISH